METLDAELECKKLENYGNGWLVCAKGKSTGWLYINKRDGNKHNKLLSSSFYKFLRDVFLPQGFPESVHADYIPYQIWDTVQAFASTILGTLTTHSIMRGVGVGESSATPLAAAVTWILKDGTGMVGRIVFAWWSGPELDAQCKKWRLFADVLNDLAMGIELTLPYFSSHPTSILCVSSVMKSLVGVAGGATRAAITQHQALSNNLADVSAKDGSQETCVNLIASLVGIFILTYMNVGSFVEIYYVVLVAVHIYANYSAVRSLRFETFNEDRLALVVKNYLTRSIVLSPAEINKRESVLLFRRPSKELCGFDIEMGASIEKIIGSSETEGATDSPLDSRILRFYRKNKDELDPDSNWERGIIIPDVKSMTIFVAVDATADSSDILDLYFKAFLTGICTSLRIGLRPDLIGESITTSGPLSTLYEKLKSAETSAAEKITQELIDEEIRKWWKLLEKTEWIRDWNLLTVGPYRSFWNSQSNFSKLE